MSQSFMAYRAAKAVTLSGESAARGRQSLDAPLEWLHDAVLISENGSILSVEPYTSFRRGPYFNIQVQDLGSMCLVPGFVNAHCHLELSYLHGKTMEGQGFSSWMRSLVSLASVPVSEEERLKAVIEALQSLHHSGCIAVGDVGSRTPGLVAKAVSLFNGELAKKERIFGKIEILHFLETFGFSASQPNQDEPPEDLRGNDYIPPTATQLLGMQAEYALSGHALYSTSPEALTAAHNWCRQHKRCFSIHLAESQEEEECLRNGTGGLAEQLRVRVLPENWIPPGLGSVRYAEKLGLLDAQTMAVHAVQCSKDDIASLASKGANVCLCPRSNAYIGVGQARAAEMADKGIVLCFGTDSLSSNRVLDMRLEMEAARDTWRFSPQAVLRMATVNGAYCLRNSQIGTLEPGRDTRFALLPLEFFD